ncbi:hypothetical protein V8E53_002116 [Lactarius tabidus]
MDDPLVHQTEVMDEEFAHVSIPGAFVVDTLLARVSQTSTLVGRLLDPVTLRLFSPFRTGFRERWEQLNWDVNGEQMRALVDTIFELVQVRARRAVDVSVPSFTDENIMEGITEQEEDLVQRATSSKVIRWSKRDGVITDHLGPHYIQVLPGHDPAPRDTTKAPEGIDAVVRTIADRLPYVNGLLKEVPRRGPATPVGMRDDEQDGPVITEGTADTVNLNVWYSDAGAFCFPSWLKNSREEYCAACATDVSTLLH